jgi:hypothetical protein
MTEDEVKKLLLEALEHSETPDPNQAFAMIVAASSGEDAELGVATRKLLPIIGVSLLAASWALKKDMMRRPQGRPRSGTLGNVDCWRAYCAWWAVKVAGKPAMSNLDAIKLCRKVDDAMGIPKDKQAFSNRAGGEDANLEQSLSRGRSKLEMSKVADDRWQSNHCDEVFSIP